eukprot:5151391-Prymnesium_polylepis.4
MGILVKNLPVYEGLATIDEVYVNIRDLLHTKNEEGKYDVEFMCHYMSRATVVDTSGATVLVNKPIKSGMIMETLDAPLTNIWTKCYELLKANLSKAGVHSEDSI